VPEIYQEFLYFKKGNYSMFTDIIATTEFAVIRDARGDSQNDNS
jgi:hypothetical protein